MERFCRAVVYAADNEHHLPFIRSGQNHLATHSERRKKTRQTEEEVRRHHQRTHSERRTKTRQTEEAVRRQHQTTHSERRTKTRQTEEELGRQHQGKDRPGVRQVPEGSGVQGKMDETGCEIICGAPTTLTVKVEMRDEMRDCHTDHHYHYTYTSPQNVAHTHPLSVCFSVTFI